ncbi:MAG: gamma-glutamylcyclotransferase [Actinomycetota bacterium]|nr:gamma-glutamylcyclotransferase [Actinomycetota bacterium]
MATYYFAYGSNMHPEEMSMRCGSARLLGSARLPDHRLGFTRRSVRNYPGSGVADLLPAPGDTVWGALYEVSEQDLGVLDHKEAAGQAYERVLVEVVGPGESRERALAYTVIDKADPEVAPSPLYLTRLVEGARACGLPDRYISFLQSLGTGAGTRSA